MDISKIKIKHTYPRLFQRRSRLYSPHAHLMRMRREISNNVKLKSIKKLITSVIIDITI